MIDDYERYPSQNYRYHAMLSKEVILKICSFVVLTWHLPKDW